ncbi:MAG: hypothetical protein KIS88_10005 [Anaerolineales bacterium]|nr:hypothetical protein [Anaerolineales bacterium]
MQKHILLALSLLLSACASAPASPTSAPSATASPAAAQASSTAEPNPTTEPTPTATPPPYSGPNPRLAVFVWPEGEEPFIEVIELGSEEIVASIPVDHARKFALSPDGRKLFYYPANGPGVIYDLESGESRLLDMTGFLRGNDSLQEVVWGPSQQRLSFIVNPTNGPLSLWDYSLENGRYTHIDQIDGFMNWSSREDIVGYVRYQSSRVTYNLATGRETVWNIPSYERIIALLTYDGFEPDYRSTSCVICLVPELGTQVRDYVSYNRSAGWYAYEIVDFETMELLAHVATFLTEGEVAQDYFLEVAKLVPLWERGDYLLFVREKIGPLSEGMQSRLYSAWSPSGEMPFTVVEGEATNTLPDVLPMAVSPDGSSFVGFRLVGPVSYPSVESVVVVDLATAEILYEYPVSSEFAFFSPPTYRVTGMHLVWPTE